MPPSDTKPSDLVERSIALTREGRYEENDQFLRGALAQFPEDPKIRLAAAAAANWREEPEVARQLVFDAVELAPEDPHVLVHAASSAFRLDDYDHAKQWATRAADMAAEDFEFWSSILHVSGKLLLVQEKWEAAEEPLRLAFEADPGMPGHARVLAWNEGKTPEALEVIDEGLRVVPGDEDLTEARERVLLKDDAMRALAELAELLRCCGRETEAAWNSAGELSLEDLRLEPSDGCDLTLEEVRKRQRELTERFGRMPLSVQRGHY